LISKPPSIKKPLLISATAFLTFYPLCLAHAATSSFGQPLSQHQSKTTSKTLQHSQLQTSLNQSLRSSNPLSVSVSLDSLKSTLSTYKEQLRLLAPNVADKARLQPLEAAISNLEAQIQRATTLQSTNATAQSTLSRATANYTKAQADLQTATALYTQQQTANQEATALYNQAITTAEEAKTALTNAQTAASQAAQNLAQATTQLQTANITLTSKLTALQQAEGSASTATQALAQAQQNYNQAELNYFIKDGNKSAALSTFNEAVQRLEAAQDNYNTNLIPDPTWTVPTYQKEHIRTITNTRQVEVRTLVPTTTMIATGGVKAEVFNRQGYNNAPPLPTANEVPISTQTVSTIDFNWGSGNILNSNRSEDVIVRFTGNLLVPQDGYYQFYASADDGTKLNIAGMEVLDDWYDKGGGGSISEPIYIRAGIFYPFTLHYYENGGGAAVNFYTYSPQQGFQIVPSTWMGSSAEQQTTYEEVITYEEETYYTYETYYTTEPVLTEGSLQVRINEGGEATFVAPQGAVFISSRLRYEAIGNPTCGADITPRNLGGNTIQLVADNSIWGDPCGGQYKHITGTLTYLGQPTAPLINDPTLLPELEAATEAKNSAEAAFEAASFDEAAALEALNEASSKVASNRSTLASATTSLAEAQLDYNSALTTQQSAADNYATTQRLDNEAQAANQAALEKEAEAAGQLLTATSNLQTSNQNLTTSDQRLKEATQTLNTSNTALTTATDVASSTTTQLTTTISEAQTTAQTTQTLLSNTQPDPKPKPEPEQGSAAIPAIIENLMAINLAQVDPTELTPAQAEQLVAAALETFETATEGSPEYEQALDALFLAAQQDDIQVDPALEAIPGVGEAAKAVVAIFNLVSNVGADIAPEKRKEAQTLVVTTLVVGQIAQTAALASASSGGSFRRK
jgi:hypothetical protein